MVGVVLRTGGRVPGIEAVQFGTQVLAPVFLSVTGFACARSIHGARED